MALRAERTAPARDSSGLRLRARDPRPPLRRSPARRAPCRCARSDQPFRQESPSPASAPASRNARRCRRPRQRIRSIRHQHVEVGQAIRAAGVGSIPDVDPVDLTHRAEIDLPPRRGVGAGVGDRALPEDTVGVPVHRPACEPAECRARLRCRLPLRQVDGHGRRRRRRTGGRSRRRRCRRRTEDLHLGDRQGAARLVDAHVATAAVDRNDDARIRWRHLEMLKDPAVARLRVGRVGDQHVEVGEAVLAARVGAIPDLDPLDRPHRPEIDFPPRRSVCASVRNGALAENTAGVAVDRPPGEAAERRARLRRRLPLRQVDGRHIRGRGRCGGRQGGGRRRCRRPGVVSPDFHLGERDRSRGPVDSDVATGDADRHLRLRAGRVDDELGEDAGVARHRVRVVGDQHVEIVQTPRTAGVGPVPHVDPLDVALRPQIDLPPRRSVRARVRDRSLTKDTTRIAVDRATGQAAERRARLRRGLPERKVARRRRSRRRVRGCRGHGGSRRFREGERHRRGRSHRWRRGRGGRGAGGVGSGCGRGVRGGRCRGLGHAGGVHRIRAHRVEAHLERVASEVDETTDATRQGVGLHALVVGPGCPRRTSTASAAPLNRRRRQARGGGGCGGCR
jgi:hypothetical protein